MSKNKQPKTKENPATGKKPKIASDPSFHKLNPSWRISKIVMADSYGWEILDAQKLVEIKDKLSNFESMTWAQILIEGKKFHHTVQVGMLCKEAQDCLVKIGQIDIDELVSLRLSGKERVWGILDRGILTLLWWDPEHEVCPSLLKNT